MGKSITFRGEIVSNKSKEIIISGGFLNPEKVGGSGIQIQYIKSRKVLFITGWFDHCVGIGGVEIPIDKFCELLGLKEVTK